MLGARVQLTIRLTILKHIAFESCKKNELPFFRLFSPQIMAQCYIHAYNTTKVCQTTLNKLEPSQFNISRIPLSRYKVQQKQK